MVGMVDPHTAVLGVSDFSAALLWSTSCHPTRAWQVKAGTAPLTSRSSQWLHWCVNGRVCATGAAVVLTTARFSLLPPRQRRFVTFLYSGSIGEVDTLDSELVEMLQLGKRYSLQRLTNLCEAAIDELLSASNVVTVYGLGRQSPRLSLGSSTTAHFMHRVHYQLSNTTPHSWRGCAATMSSAYVPRIPWDTCVAAEAVSYPVVEQNFAVVSERAEYKSLPRTHPLRTLDPSTIRKKARQLGKKEGCAVM